MKTTTVPAQVTTVEDKIAGSLNLTQLMLLCAPIFLSAVLYILLPPLVKFTYTKLALFIVLIIGFSTLSLRIRGKLVVQWIVIIGRYNLRPRYFVYDKNDQHLRMHNQSPKQTIKKSAVTELKKSLPILPKLPMPQLVALQEAVNDPRAKLTLNVSRKGGFDVRITEIK